MSPEPRIQNPEPEPETPGATRTYIQIIVFEALVIAALWFVARAFSS